jgi:transcriptional regulator with XRE-family HTH domain
VCDWFPVWAHQPQSSVLTDHLASGLAPWVGILLMKKEPNPIDRHVGTRLRSRRIGVGMSQEKLGDALGITFQQIQKYEKGANRIGASRLQLASKVLGVPVNYFFDGAPAAEDAGGFSEEHVSSYRVSGARDAHEAALLNAFSRVRDRKLRLRIVELVEALVPMDAR